MPRILVIVFWCWFAFSVAVLLRRAFRKTTGRSSTPTQDDLRTRPTWPPLHEIDPLPADTAARDEPSTDDAQPAETDAQTDAPTPAPATSEPYDAPMPQPAASGARATTQVQTRPRVTSLGDALRGIRMPCDLTPLTGTAADFERRAAFFSVRYPAETVAPQVADELERIGMTFTATSDNTAIAERDGARVQVTVRSVGAAVDGTTDLVYPTAPEHCVIVELELE